MDIKVILIDINPKMIKAWRDTFEGNPEVEIVQGSMLQQQVSAWVTPTNARGSMDGGLDLVIKNHLGGMIEKRLQQKIKDEYGGTLPVGHAICTPTDRVQPRFVISTPTMVGSSDNVSATMNVALACAAAFQAINNQNHREPGSIRSFAIPGLGANTGRVPVEICADLMWTGYNIFQDRQYRTFEQLRIALEEQLGDLNPMSGKVTAPKSAPVATDDDEDEDDDDIDMDEDEGDDDGDKKKDKDFNDFE